MLLNLEVSSENCPSIDFCNMNHVYPRSPNTQSIVDWSIFERNPLFELMTSGKPISVEMCNYLGNPFCESFVAMQFLWKKMSVTVLLEYMNH